MKLINISTKKYPNLFTQVDDSDFELLSQFRWYFDGKYAKRHQYIKGSGRKKKLVISFLLHRLINQTPKGMETDHINRNKLDNRKSNLRTVTSQQNNINKGLTKNNKSGFKGVSWSKDHNKWVATITKDYKTIFLGRYTYPEEASNAYTIAAEKYFRKVQQ